MEPIRGLSATIELWTKALGLGYLITLTLGGFLMCCYFLRHGFNPGVSVSDALALSLFTIAFLFILALLASFGAVGCYPILRTGSALWRRVRAHRSASHPPIPSRTVALEWKPVMKFYFVSGIVIDALIVLLLIVAPLPIAVQYAVTFLAFGMLPCIALFARRVEVYSPYPRIVPEYAVDRWYQRLPSWRRDLFAISAVTASLSLVALPDIQDVSMKSFGYRKDGVDGRLKKEDFDYLMIRSMTAGSTLNDCEAIVPGEFLVRKIDILWHNFGNKALLRYPSVSMWQPDPGTGFRMEVPNGDLKLVHATGSRRPCVEITNASLFDKTETKKSAEVALQEKFAFLGNVAGATATITMFAPSNDTDLAPRTAQGEALRKLLLSRFGFAKVDLVVPQGTDNHIKWNCDTVPQEIRTGCRAANARVDISFGAR